MIIDKEIMDELDDLDEKELQNLEDKIEYVYFCLLLYYMKKK